MYSFLRSYQAQIMKVGTKAVHLREAAKDADLLCISSCSKNYFPLQHSHYRENKLPESSLNNSNQKLSVSRTFHQNYLRWLSTAAQPAFPSEDENVPISPAVEQPRRVKFKRLDKTARHIMNILDKESVEKVCAEREIADIKPGSVVQMKVEVPENKRRTSVIKGIVIARRNAGVNTTFRLRRLVDGVGVECVYPLYSPNIKEMKVLEQKKVRRAKLYYLRDRMNALNKK